MKKYRNSHYHHLRKKWQTKHNELEKKLIANHGQLLSSLIPRQQLIGGIMLAATPFIGTNSLAQVLPFNQPSRAEALKQLTPEELSIALKQNLPDSVKPLTPNEENIIAATLSANFHLKIVPQLNGVRLDRTYGIIGKEQHLLRYPGDSSYQHNNDYESLSSAESDGTAPGLGAWGYFASSQSQMTQVDVLRERWYIAVPTFLAPGWNQHVGEYGLFFKYRKMLVVNPDNGKAVVADIADAGPAPWTGKNLGGSPEVMNYLGRVDGSGRGPVLYFFIDDPNDTIPLGPRSL